ncbi:hypothetical protein LUW74_07710 [Actinomadura madurae]|uniref:hypothetical protein n=1 Tax=Actinomadura madurae TaxID=1993 RepID=UPI002025C2DF|nr:hypothetical protein [Actinomadura madurae]URN03243.1 hypothetical protein LUW74_07710 [Actinomadura madurae]
MPPWQPPGRLKVPDQRLEVFEMVNATRPAAGGRDKPANAFGYERTDLAARFVVRAAILWPSIHNTQPWRFVDRADGLELWADRARLLPMADPTGREMVTSCGAALFNARLAVRHLGFTPRVALRRAVGAVMVSRPAPTRSRRTARVSSRETPAPRRHGGRGIVRPAWTPNPKSPLAS